MYTLRYKYPTLKEWANVCMIVSVNDFGLFSFERYSKSNIKSIVHIFKVWDGLVGESHSFRQRGILILRLCRSASHNSFRLNHSHKSEHRLKTTSFSEESVLLYVFQIRTKAITTNRPSQQTLFLLCQRHWHNKGAPVLRSRGKDTKPTSGSIG